MHKNILPEVYSLTTAKKDTTEIYQKFRGIRTSPVLTVKVTASIPGYLIPIRLDSHAIWSSPHEILYSYTLAFQLQNK